MKTKLRVAADKCCKSALTVLCLALVCACAKKVSFTNSSIVPAAGGVVKMKHDPNNNYVVDVSVTNLASPEKLSPPRKTYVVWLETDGNGIQNMGRINSSTRPFSDALRGSLTTTIPYRPTRVFITAEDAGDIRYPGQMVVLKTEPFSLRKR